MSTAFLQAEIAVAGRMYLKMSYLIEIEFRGFIKTQIGTRIMVVCNLASLSPCL